MLAVLGGERILLRTLAVLAFLVLVPVVLALLVASAVTGMALFFAGLMLTALLGLCAIMLAVLRLPPIRIKVPRAQLMPEPVVEVIQAKRRRDDQD